MWRRSEVDYLDGAVVYLDDPDAFAREPMSARFETSDGLRFVVSGAHETAGYGWLLEPNGLPFQATFTVAEDRPR